MQLKPAKDFCSGRPTNQEVSVCPQKQGSWKARRLTEIRNFTTSHEHGIKAKRRTKQLHQLDCKLQMPLPGKQFFSQRRDQTQIALDSGIHLIRHVLQRVRQLVVQGEP